MSRLKIAILFGGACEEHPVSVKSAQEVARSLDPERYDPVWVGITKAGEWVLCDGPEPGWESGRRVAISPDRGTHGLLVLGDEGVETVRLDVVLPVLHGRLGEDGAIQGLLELAALPYVGCDLQSSALAMDKSLAYLVAAAAGVAVPTHRVIVPGQVVDPAELTFPVFVKPARSGSSYGVSKVTEPEQLASAIDAARRFDTKVLIEQAVRGSEVGCAVLGVDDLLTGEVDRIALSGGFFRIHQENSPEQGSENSTPIVPADIPPAASALVKETAKKVYRALGCRGLARVDLFLLADGSVMLNEVNTLPGLTSYSRYPRMMAAAGLSLGEVVDRLVALALEAASESAVAPS